MVTTFELSVVEPGGHDRPLSFTPERVYNLGSATVESASAVAHQQEVADVGVQIAFDVPAPRVYPMTPSSVTTDEMVGSHHGRTSGEAEIVLLVDGDEMYVGIGSDHTDRELERTSIIWSKQYSPSVLGRRVWSWRYLERHWDDLVVESTVDGVAYQSSKASVFLAPPAILDRLAERAVRLPSSYLVFCGTYTSIDNTIRFGRTWSATLRNTVDGSQLSLSYEVVDLLAELHPAHRVPLRAGER